MVQIEDVSGMPGRSNGCENIQPSFLGGGEGMQEAGRREVVGGFYERSLRELPVTRTPPFCGQLLGGSL